MASWTIHDGVDLYAKVHLVVDSIAVTQISERAVREGFLKAVKKSLIVYNPLEGLVEVLPEGNSFIVELWIDQYVQDRRIMGNSFMMYESEGVDLPDALKVENTDPNVVY